MRPAMLVTIVACHLALLAGVGCSSSKPAGEPAFAEPPPPSTGARIGMDSRGKVIVTPSEALTGKVVSVNQAGRFAVLNFPIGKMPALEKTMLVYRQGLKVGEVRITGPQRDDHIVADLATGDCQPGDDVRDR